MGQWTPPAVLSGYADPFPQTDAAWLASLKRAGNVALKPWRAPRLHDEGAEFKPTAAAVGRVVGELVEWTEYEAVRSLSGIPTGERREITRRGQVWSGCPKAPGAVWVAPEDGGPAVALSKTLDVLP